MGEFTKIEWADATFNAWVGCEVVSAECDHCYARSGSARLGAQHRLKLWDGDRFFTGANYWKQPARWNREAEDLGRRLRVFTNSYADVFEDRPDLVEPRKRLFALIEATPNLDWLLLSKRPENMLRLAEPLWGNRWPDNAWAGTTVGLASSLVRAVKLTGVLAARLFLSMGPLLEDVDLDPPVCPNCLGLAYVDGPVGATPFCPECGVEMRRGWIIDPMNGGVSWVIVEGESGRNARPFHLEWARRIKKQCRDADVAFFFKQAGANAYEGGKRLALKHAKGGDLTELPEDLRVREIPPPYPR
ncbi:MAG TPA: DUF5131 family protein [Polyangiaceae bacterium]